MNKILKTETLQFGGREDSKDKLDKNNIPPLIDLCLLQICKRLNETEVLSTLPDFPRTRLGTFFQRKQFIDTITALNYCHCYKIDDEELKNITPLVNVTYLNLSHCEKLTGICLSYVGKLSKLDTLILNHCSQISMGFCFLIDLKLTKLEIAFCEVMDPLMPFLQRITTLTHLNLMCNRLTDDGMSKLETLKELTSLIISMNPLITDETLVTLAKLTKLQSLNLNFCKLLSGDGIKSLVDRPGSVISQLDMIGCDKALTDTKSRPLILLAEDSKVQARMIGMVLNRYNFDVEVASNGEMALEMFRANPRYDLVLMDVVMPLMDGPTCVKQIREYETSKMLKRTPIIIQTADTRDSQRSTCLEAGCDEFLAKPLDKACISLAKELMEARQRNMKKKKQSGEKTSIDKTGEKKGSMDRAMIDNNNNSTH